MSQLSRKKKFVSDGIFRAELASFLEEQLGEDGFGGVTVKSTPSRTDVLIKTTNTRKVLGEGGRRIHELTAMVQQRFGFSEGGVELYAERIENRGLSAAACAESIKFKLIGGLPVRRACVGILRSVMESGAKGVEIVVGGKIRGQRARTVKFRDGYMLKAGQPAADFVDSAVRHVYLRQGVLGVKVSIMLPHDSEGKRGVSKIQPDIITVYPPKEDEIIPENITIIKPNF